MTIDQKVFIVGTILFVLFAVVVSIYNKSIKCN